MLRLQHETGMALHGAAMACGRERSVGLVRLRWHVVGGWGVVEGGTRARMMGTVFFCIQMLISEVRPDAS